MNAFSPLAEVRREHTIQTAAAGKTDEIAWPSPPDKAAYHGLAGEFVHMVEPHTEADPVAILGQFLAAFGNAAHRHPHFTAEADRHGANLFIALVGETAKGRKGTSWGYPRNMMAMADESWQTRIASGSSSGEGLIWQVRDAIERHEPRKEKGRVVDYETVIVDEGVSDKRLLVFEGEFASTLRVLSREGNTLSAVIRNAWDTGELRTLTKNSPAQATGAHISIIGHITRDELLRYLNDIEAANGFANRFLWLCARRSNVLPDGGSLNSADLVPIAQSIREALKSARTVGQITRDQEAREIWHAVYPKLSEGRPGLLGAVTARSEAQVMRLALIYALLDRSSVIAASHLKAALALWDFAEDSAEFIFGERLGDNVADAILDALNQHRTGLTRTDMRDLFARHVSAIRIDAALSRLSLSGRARRVIESTDGRPAERWIRT